MPTGNLLNVTSPEHANYLEKGSVSSSSPRNHIFKVAVPSYFVLGHFLPRPSAEKLVHGSFPSPNFEFSTMELAACALLDLQNPFPTFVLEHSVGDAVFVICLDAGNMPCPLKSNRPILFIPISVVMVRFQVFDFRVPPSHEVAVRFCW